MSGSMFDSLIKLRSKSLSAVVVPSLLEGTGKSFALKRLVSSASKSDAHKSSFSTTSVSICLQYERRYKSKREYLGTSGTCLCDVLQFFGKVNLTRSKSSR